MASLGVRLASLRYRVASLGVRMASLRYRVVSLGSGWSVWGQGGQSGGQDDQSGVRVASSVPGIDVANLALV